MTARRRALPSVPATVLLAVTLLATGCSSDSSTAQIAPDNTPVVDAATSARAQQILENIKFEIPQLREIPVIMGDIHDGSVAGMDFGSFLVQGQSYYFLVTEDSEKLFLLAAPELNVGRSAEALATAYAEEEEAADRAAAERAQVLADAAESLPMKGPADAPVTIVEFSDFQCPFCQRALPQVEELLERYPEQVRLAYAHYPLPNHPWARPAAIAAECAAAQDPEVFWTLHDAYFANQQSINPGNVIERTRGFLVGTGVDMDTWAACATDDTSDGYRAASATIDEAMALGRQFQVTGTPAFFIEGRLVSGAKPIEEFVEAVEAALAN